MLIRHAWFEDMLGMSGDLDETMSRVAGKIAATGITTLQDAIVTPDTLAAYGRLETNGQMTFRFRAAMVEPPTENIDEIDVHLDMLKSLKYEYANYEYVSADAVKLFADAVLEGNPLTLPPTLPVAAMLDAAAALYVGRALWRWMSSKPGGSCGSCSSCDENTAGAPKKTLVTLDERVGDL